ncbi:hypothetical protein [Chroococcidiopsis sp. SAG 2025]|nr:hypothetical protein [Chroococcidiopsis sp. SAG 2025]
MRGAGQQKNSESCRRSPVTNSPSQLANRNPPSSDRDRDCYQ